MKIKKTVLAALACILIIGCSRLSTLNEKNEGTGPEFILVPGGTFQMGDSWNFSDEDAMPVHAVDIDSFYLSKFEVTVAQYAAFARENKYPLPDSLQSAHPDRPVTYVNWEEAQDYCECYGWRLPTEPEWEYAARSGGQLQRYSGTDDRYYAYKYAVSLDDDPGFPQPVGSKLPNGLGIFDLSGNVFEWIGDYYARYSSGPDPDWANMSGTNIRIIRGGSFSTYPIPNYTRIATFVDQRSPRVGFRCAKDWEAINN